MKSLRFRIIQIVKSRPLQVFDPEGSLVAMELRVK